MPDLTGGAKKSGLQVAEWENQGIKATLQDRDSRIQIIPAEFVYPQLFHKRGALSAARLGDEVNPERERPGFG